MMMADVCFLLCKAEKGFDLLPVFLEKYLINVCQWGLGANQLSTVVSLSINNFQEIYYIVVWLLPTDTAILTQPSNLIGVILGSNVTLSIVAGGGGAIGYAWQYSNGSQLPPGGRFQGVSSPVLTIGPASQTDNGSSFSCLVINGAGVSIASQVATVLLGEFFTLCL